VLLLEAYDGESDRQRVFSSRFCELCWNDCRVDGAVVDYREVVMKTVLEFTLVVKVGREPSITELENMCAELQDKVVMALAHDGFQPSQADCQCEIIESDNAEPVSNNDLKELEA
jgi:hypothetical protein